MPGRVPDFFIIGAPKSGTTALSEYLRTHPGVFFCQPKEPFFYSADYAHRGRIGDRDDYLALFAQAPAGALLGEGSTWYLRSEVAVPRILADNPNARFIVMLREPASMLRSLHEHLLRELYEDIEDLPSAWSAQADRARGRRIPRFCSDPKLLQYKQVCSLGEQLERLLSLVPRSQLLVHIFEEFIANPAASYARTLVFLDLPPDGRADFPRINEIRDYRSRLLTRFAGHAKQRWGEPYRTLKTLANRVGCRPGAWITRSNKRAVPARSAERGLQGRVREELRAEVERVEHALGRRIEVWHEPAQRPPQGMIRTPDVALERGHGQ